tara:strand:- start:704 stop:805 length:102 start_codon:yes stop_codon:yes gene_type:complete
MLWLLVVVLAEDMVVAVALVDIKQQAFLVQQVQ